MPEFLKYKRSSLHITARQRAHASSKAADINFLNEMAPLCKPRKPEEEPKEPKYSEQLDRLIDSSIRTPNPAKRNPSRPADESAEAMIETAFRNANHKREPDKYYYDIARKMQFPTQEKLSAGSPDAYRALENTRKTMRRAFRTVRSRPAVGRTIEVVPERGVDVGRALSRLDMACTVNRIRLDAFRQRFHERPGMERKRLKSERWRRMFKESFKATVRRVKEMTRKGW